jgi:sugar phosphate isomerase/epimerase
MKLSFSTLACPDWTLPCIVAIASSAGYDGIELRFVEGEDSLWKLPVFQPKKLLETRRLLADHGLKISCLDTSCRFHSPDPQARASWVTEGKRMADLAAELEAPGLRVFGDTIQPGADRESTRSWIAEGIRKLAETSGPKGVEIWLESHGDFATAPDTAAVLIEAACPHIGAIWDPANAFVAASESPDEGARLGTAIRHVHIKDLHLVDGSWKPVLPGDGDFPLQELLGALPKLNYHRFVSFEWEKKWHPEIEDPEIALPHFVDWFRKH